jgi:hypothetical protein
MTDWMPDNSSAACTPGVRDSAAANRIEQPRPAYASHLNTIECHSVLITDLIVNEVECVDRDAFV